MKTNHGQSGLNLNMVNVTFCYLHVCGFNAGVAFFPEWSYDVPSVPLPGKIGRVVSLEFLLGQVNLLFGVPLRVSLCNQQTALSEVRCTRRLFPGCAFLSIIHCGLSTEDLFLDFTVLL